MEDLFSVVSENVQLAVRDGDESVFVERIAGRGSMPVLTQVGGRCPLHATGVGRVLLADVRRDGYAVNERQVTADTLSVAAPGP